MSRASSARSERGEPFPRRASQGAVDTPFVTELNTPRRYSISVRSDRSENPAPNSARVIRRMSVIPRQKVKLPPLPKEEEQGFYDQNTLIQQYEALYEEVSALKKEIEPIRKQYLQLQDDLLYQSRCANSSEIDFAYYAPALSEAIGNGTFSSAIDNFQWQSFENTDEMSNLQSELSVYAVVRLAIEVDDARSELAEMRQDLEELKDQERQCRAQVARTKRQFPRQRILEQLDIIRDIQVSIARYELKNKKLEDEICDLEEQTAGISEDHKEEFEEIENLSFELNEKRQRYYAKCNEMIEIRKQQMREIEDLGAKQHGFKPAEPTNERQTGRTFTRPEALQSFNEPVDEVISFDN